MNKPRPKHLVLYQINLPLPALISFLHRVSGMLLFLALPVLLLLLQFSLHSIETYTQLLGILNFPPTKLILLLLAWAFFHHLCAGIRYLALDFHYGLKLKQARASSKWVLFVSLALTALAGIKLW
jgi:succinate dehydrogenase / fumarate reductase cytochrome b subunit